MGNPRRPSGNGRGGAGGGGGGEDALHAAARAGDLATVQSIVFSNPLAVNSRDRHSRTPLHLAAWSGQTEVVRFLCSNKADVGAAAMDDMGAIHFASQKGHLEVVRVLLSSGVSVKVANRKGFTPLHYAVQGSHLELIKYLIRKGANLSVKTKAGKSPADFAENNEIQSSLAEFEKLFKKEKEETVITKTDESMEDQSIEKNVKDEHEKVNDNGQPAVENEHESDIREKRKGGHTEIEEGSPKPKKAKVALGHLMAEDDLQEEE